MSWQQFKLIGDQLHTDLAGKHPPAHIRAILKVIEGELLREELRGETAEIPTPNSSPPTPVSGEALAQQIYELLRVEEPRRARQILTVVDSLLTHHAMGGRGREARELYTSLRKEFAPGPLRMIITAAERAGKRAAKDNQ